MIFLVEDKKYEYIGYDYDILRKIVTQKAKDNIVNMILNPKNREDLLCHCGKNKYIDSCKYVIKSCFNNMMYINQPSDQCVYNKYYKGMFNLLYFVQKLYLNILVNDLEKIYSQSQIDYILERSSFIKLSISEVELFIKFINNDELTDYYYKSLRSELIHIFCDDNIKSGTGVFYSNYRTGIYYDSSNFSRYGLNDELGNEFCLSRLDIVKKISHEYRKEKERLLKEERRRLGRNKKYHYVYLITDTLNNKFYIGKHSTNDMGDNYMGSGIDLRKAQKEIGMKYFKKEIIHMCISEEEAYEMERYEIEKVKAYENNMYYNLI